MKRVMVTGAAGYIGSVLTRLLLAEGYQVVAVDRFFFGRETLPSEHPKLSILKEDIRWIDEAHLSQMDAVIDLAALSNDPAGELEPEKTWEINHRGRVRMAQLSKKMGVPRYIFPSSCSVYGAQDGLLDETSPPNPLTTYAKANLQAEEDILPLADGRFCAVVLRQATVYGLSQRMRFDLAISGMVRGLFLGGKMPILRDGTQWRPFIHVKDTSRAMLLTLEAPRELVNGQVFNVGSADQNCQILALARTVSEAVNIPFEYEWYGLPDHRSYRVNFSKIAEMLGFTPAYTPVEGAREVYQALQEGALDPDDPRTITVGWYKHLMEIQRFLGEVELEGVLL